LVTRPCAAVRGVLAYPATPGLERLAAPVAAPAGPASAAQADAVAKRAIGATALQTAQLQRRDAAATGGVASAARFVAPLTATLGAVERAEAATGAAGDGVDIGHADVHRALSSADYSLDMWRRIARRALVLVHALQVGGAENAGRVLEALDAAGNGLGGVATVDARERRDALWSQFQRHVGIAHDRLWVFVRTLSGCIGGDVNEVVAMADESSVRAAKAAQEQKLAVAKRVSDAQAKIVETVVGSMLRNTKLVVGEGADNSLVVIDDDARQQLRDLASGESGRPFFEANVAMRNLSESERAPKTPLVALLSGLSDVGVEMQAALEKVLVQGGAGASATLEELSHPSNAYYVSMRADAMASIRTGHERLNVELGAVGRRRLALWECVEGGCAPLTTRFAEFCGFLLAQARASTGVAAMYVSQQAIYTNSQQARIALARLVAVGLLYATRVPPMDTSPTDGVNLRLARNKVLQDGEAVSDADVGAATLRGARGTGSNRALPDQSGWGFVAGAGPFRKY
jgi:hypothetical protein